MSIAGKKERGSTTTSKCRESASGSAFSLSKDGAVEWGLAERAFAARGGVLFELFALLLPQDVIGIKPRVDTRGGRTQGIHSFSH
jgi:hypothetical protein